MQGFAAGFGLDLAVACDLRIAGASARFTSAFARMGLVPDGGSTFTLPRLVGVGPALRLLMAGETLDAAQAHAIGLVDEVVDDASMEEGITAVTEKLFAAAPASIRAIKRLVRAGELGALEKRWPPRERHSCRLCRRPSSAGGWRSFSPDSRRS